MRFVIVFFFDKFSLKSSLNSIIGIVSKGLTQFSDPQYLQVISGSILSSSYLATVKMFRLHSSQRNSNFMISASCFSNSDNLSITTPRGKSVIFTI